MKCPFELPLRKYQADKNSRYCEIHSSSGHIADLVTLEEADYIIKVINSHEKLVEELQETRKLLHDKVFKEAEKQ